METSSNTQKNPIETQEINAKDLLGGKSIKFEQLGYFVGEPDGRYTKVSKPPMMALNTARSRVLMVNAFTKGKTALKNVLHIDSEAVRVFEVSSQAQKFIGSFNFERSVRAITDWHLDDEETVIKFDNGVLHFKRKLSYAKHSLKHLSRQRELSNRGEGKKESLVGQRDSSGEREDGDLDGLKLKPSKLIYEAKLIKVARPELIIRASSGPQSRAQLTLIGKEGIRHRGMYSNFSKRGSLNLSSKSSMRSFEFNARGDKKLTLVNLTDRYLFSALVDCHVGRILKRSCLNLVEHIIPSALPVSSPSFWLRPTIDIDDAVYIKDSQRLLIISNRNGKTLILSFKNIFSKLELCFAREVTPKNGSSKETRFEIVCLEEGPDFLLIERPYKDAKQSTGVALMNSIDLSIKPFEIPIEHLYCYFSQKGLSTSKFSLLGGGRILAANTEASSIIDIGKKEVVQMENMKFEPSDIECASNGIIVWERKQGVELVRVRDNDVDCGVEAIQVKFIDIEKHFGKRPKNEKSMTYSLSKMKNGNFILCCLGDHLGEDSEVRRRVVLIEVAADTLSIVQVHKRFSDESLGKIFKVCYDPVTDLIVFGSE